MEGITSYDIKFLDLSQKGGLSQKAIDDAASQAKVRNHLKFLKNILKLSKSLNVFSEVSNHYNRL